MILFKKLTNHIAAFLYNDMTTIKILIDIMEFSEENIIINGLSHSRRHTQEFFFKKHSYFTLTQQYIA